jgi:hypothetical protein
MNNDGHRGEKAGEWKLRQLRGLGRLPKKEVDRLFERPNLIKTTEAPGAS